MAAILVAITYNQLSNTPYIFTFIHRDSLDLDKIHEKELQVNNNSFTECHTEGLITKAN